MQPGDLQRVLEVVEGGASQAQTSWAHRGRVQRQGLEGLDSMSRRPKRRGLIGAESSVRGSKDLIQCPAT